jgi:hypothetical protein
MNENFLDRWRNRFGLPSKGWKSELARHLRELPLFLPVSQSASLLFSLFDKVPRLLKRHGDSDTAQMAEAFAWCCFAFWQARSAFPAFAESYARFLRKELFRRNRSEHARLLARMIMEFNSHDGQCGFNRLELADPVAVRESERLIAGGEYEFYLNARLKYDEYAFYLSQSQMFKNEWSAVKLAFPKKTAQEGIIRRSFIPERNWERGRGAQFKTNPQKFQAVFDLFCWKYFLWGMRDDEPLLMKPSVVFTPLGTQIFIPGYLSLDSKRDLDFKRINKLHKARGLPRQGEEYLASRKEQLDLKSKALEANHQAQSRALKGDKRYAFICARLGLRDDGEYRKIRKLLQRKIT